MAYCAPFTGKVALLRRRIGRPRGSTALPFWLVGYSSGQRGQTVNLLAYAYEGSNPSPTTIFNF